MGMTKGELAQDALGMIGVNTRTSDANAEELQATIRTMDRFLRSQSARSIQLGYDYSSQDPTTDSLLPAWAEQWVVASVAKLMCPFFGTNATPELMQAIAAGKLTIDQRTIQIPKVQAPRGMPLGTGYAPYGCTRAYPAERLEGDDGQFLEGDDGAFTIN